MKLVKISRPNEYIRGVVGSDIPLTFTQRLRILFSNGIQVTFIEPRLCKQRKEAGDDHGD